jgi:hypothetical protein
LPKLLTKEEARRIAVNIAKLQELLHKPYRLAALTPLSLLSKNGEGESRAVISDRGARRDV